MKKGSSIWKWILIAGGLLVALLLVIFNFATFTGLTGLQKSGSGTGGNAGGGSAGPGSGPGEGAGECTFNVVSKDPPGANIVRVVVPIHKPTGGLGTLPLQVHRNCAEAIHVIFQQIYESTDQPIIQRDDTGCYSNRGAGSTSRHNWGVACDINWTENFCIMKSGSICGPPGFWKPGDISPDNTYVGWSSGKNVLSIPISSTVSTAFFSQGWGRGLWTKKNDFMHYSVDGD